MDMDVDGGGGRGRGYLPEALLMEILAWLPVKSLVCCKCVCKYWFVLIQSPNFVSTHYHHPNNPSYLIVRRVIGKPPKHASESDSDPSDHPENIDTQSTLVARMSIVFQDDDDDDDETLITPPPTLRLVHDEDIVRFRKVVYHNMIGPIDGLFLMHNSPIDRLVIWNPCTTEVKLLPNPTFEGIEFPPIARTSVPVFGFGLDPLMNNYKVVWIPVVGRGFPREAAVYNLGTNSWRHFGPVSNLGTTWFVKGGYDLRSNATYLDGCYYWLLRRNNREYKILLFDMGSDMFNEIPVPACCNNINRSPPIASVSMRLLLLCTIAALLL